MEQEVSKRKTFDVLKTQLESERSSFISHWRDIADYVVPRRPRFTVSDVNKGDRRNQKIIDSTATLALRTLRSGMMSGITSPARPWFRLTTPDPDLSEFGSVKSWLDLVTRRMSTVFLRSNLYNVLPVVYADLGAFGTGCMYVEENAENGIHAYPFPIGSYCIANNELLRVDVFSREFRMTVRQLVMKFGYDPISNEIDWSKISNHVKRLWDMGQFEQWIDVCHFIKPNEEFDPNKGQSRFKKYISVYYEVGEKYQADAYDQFLSMKGYDFFPILAPRWEVTGEDVYGTSCPGMEVLGDVKQLQLGEKRAAQAIEKMVNPPMTGPTHLKTAKPSILPGDITYVDVREGQQGFRPVHEVNFRIQELEQKQEQLRDRIRRGFYEDLFLMLASLDRRQITAREIEERHEEKLLALGPVLEQLNQDLLDPLIDNTFDIMVQQGMIPEPPEDLQGVKLKVEYISIMAQAQKLVGIGSIERFSTFAANLAQINPQTLDKIDMDQLIDVYGDMTSIPPGLVRPDEEVAKVRASRAKQQQAMVQAQMMQQGAQVAKDLSSAKTGDQNLLTEITGSGSPGFAPAARIL